MNKKFFAALASATMAFTASGSIAVFADDFVEEKAPVLGGNDVKPTEKTVKWDKEHFGDLVSVTEGATWKGVTWSNGQPTLDNGYVKTEDLSKVTGIELQSTFKGEIKGLEYFSNLETFAAKAGTVENKTLDFSENTKLKSLELETVRELTKIVLPEASVDKYEKETYKLDTLTVKNTKLNSLDLSKYTELGKTGAVTVSDNKNLRTIALPEGTPKTFTGKVDFKNNGLEEINLENCNFEGDFELGGNFIGVLDLSKTTFKSAPNLGTQTLYVSEDLATINVKDTFDNVDTHDFEKTGNSTYNKKTGVLTLSNTTNGYAYTTLTTVADKEATPKLSVNIAKANPMHRLYNPNSGEHFYTADVKEKEALVALGWNDEGFGWVAKETPNEADKAKYAVYRLYNPNAGDHHYTMSEDERDTLIAYGWKDEKTGWYSADQKGQLAGGHVVVYRQYNPNATGAGSHNYTTDKAENDYLVSLGWTYEGAAWTALR